MEQGIKEDHKLPSDWEFWVIQANIEYEIESIISFSTIEEFWNYYLQFPNILQMKTGGFALFKKGIKPAWEDSHNRGGTRVKIQESLTKEKFDFIICAMISGTIEQKLQAKLCGLYVNVTNKMQIEIWFGQNINVFINQNGIQILAETLDLNPKNLQALDINPKI